MNKILALILVSLISLPTLATQVRDTTLVEMYGESDVVIYGLVESAKVIANDCGVEYTVRAEASFKGEKAPGATVRLRSGDPMQVGASYYLFLSLEGDGFTPLLSTNSGHTKLRQEFDRRCSEVLPPYEVNVFGNGALKETGTYATGATQAVLIDSIIVPPPQLKVTKLGQRDRYDYARADAALISEELRSYLRALSED